MRGWRRLAALMLAAFSIGLLAQEQPVPQFRSTVDLVPLDVTVLDKNHKPVRGLTAADFIVLEDGKPRPVVTFEPVELGAPSKPAPSAAAWTRDVPNDMVTNQVKPEGRLVTIVMDRTIRPDDVPIARNIALRTVDELAPGDLASLVFTSQFAGRGKSIDFTDDRARLRAAIQAPFATAFVTGPEQRLFDPDNLESGDCLCGACVLEAITRIADSVRDVVGRRKVLFFIGSYARVDEPMTIGGPNQAVSCTSTLSHARERMVRATQWANLAVISFDAVGMETCDNSPLPNNILGCQKQILKRQVNFRSLADTLHSRTIMNTNTPEALVASVLDESSVFYLLGFERASSLADGREHKIEVKTRRGGVTISARNAYVAEKPDMARKAESASLVSAPLAAAITGVLPRTELALGASVASFAATPERTLTTVAIHVQRPATAADMRRGGGARKTEIVVAAFDRQGQSVATARQTAELATDAPSAAVMLQYEVLTYLNLKPGHYDLRVGATDETSGDTGSVHTTIDVPDFDRERLALSEVVLTTSLESAAAISDELAAVLPVMPTPRRTFARAEHPTAFLRVYQGGHDAPAAIPVSARIVDVNDHEALHTTVTLRPDQFGARRSADYRFALPLPSLPPGEYLLTVSGTLQNDVKRRDLRFVVR